MLSHNLQTSVTALLVATFVTACGTADDEPYDPERDESFLALMNPTDGKADGLYVAEDSADAKAVLQVVNEYEFAQLESEVGLDRRLIANLLAHRRGSGTPDPYDSLVELDATPWTTLAAFSRIVNHVRAIDLVDQTFCQQQRCFTVDTIELDLEGELYLHVAGDGTWWARSHAGGTTVREARGAGGIDAVNTTSYDESDIQPWVVRRLDGSLTAVTRVGDRVVTELGPALELGSLNTAVAAAAGPSGDLFVAAAAHDSAGLVQGIVIFRQLDEGWVEEFKHALAASPGDTLNAAFAHDSDGGIVLWADVDDDARKFSRGDAGWRESMRLNMSEAGFGSHPDDRTVTFHTGDGAVFIHRATWNFSRKQEVVRVDDNMVTAVIDLPTRARTIAPHADNSFSVVLADGSLTHMRDDGLDPASSIPLGPASPDDIVRTNGDDIYVLQGSTLRILRAR